LKFLRPAWDKIFSIANKPFAKSVALIASGGAIAQVLNFAVSPILSRLFTPEAFGLLGLFVAVSGLLSACSTLRYELPIVIARQLQAGAALVHLCIVISVIMAVISSVIIFFWGNNVGATFNVPQLVPYLYLVPFSILFSGIFLAFSQWACRRKEFGLLAKNPITRTGTTLTINLGAGLMSLGQGWLIFGFVMGQLAAGVGVALRIMKKDWKVLRPRIRAWRRIVAMAKRYRRFPQFSAPQAMVNVASQQMPNFILGFFFGPVTLGLYWLTVRVLHAPSILIGQSVRQVYYQKVCENLNLGRSILPLLIKATLGLVTLGAVCFLPIILFGPFIFSIVFGEPWIIAGEYARWVSLWSWAGFTNVPAFCSIQALGLQKELFVYETILFVIRNGALLIFSMAGSPLDSIIAFAITGFFFNTALVLYAFKASKVRYKV